MQAELLDIEKGISDTDRNQVDESFLHRSIVDAHDKLNLAKRVRILSFGYICV